jgi:hypothetical protein
MTLFFDTLAVADLKQSAIYTFRARAALAFRGKVKLVSGMRIDTGRVFIRGTGRMCQVDSSGAYDLGLLPADAERMGLGVRLVSSPVTVLKATQVAPVKLDSLGQTVYTCKALSEDSAAKTVDQARALSEATPSSQPDTARMDSVLRACGVVERGSVINYSGGPAPSGTGILTSQPVTVLVLDGTDSAHAASSKAREPVAVPLSECVPSAGREATSYEVEVRAGSGTNDLIIGDVAEKCLGP